jgi:hypothetical protein
LIVSKVIFFSERPNIIVANGPEDKAVDKDKGQRIKDKVKSSEM